MLLSTLMVSVDEPEPPEMLVVLKEFVAPAGDDVADSVTVPENPLDPEARVRLAGLDEIVKSGDNPGPSGAPRGRGKPSGARMTAYIIGTKHTKKTNKIATNFLEEE